MSIPSTEPERTPPDPRMLYAERAVAFDGEAVLRDGQARRLGWGRLASFLAGLTVVWRMAPRENMGAFVLAIACFGLFLYLIPKHRQARARKRRAELMSEYNSGAVARLDRDWEALSKPPEKQVDPHHGYARDLDITGAASLAQLLGTPGTDPGWQTLYEWMLSGAPPDVTARRQDAVREATAHVDLREAIAAEGRLAQELVRSTRKGKGDAFLEWAEGSDPLLRLRPLAVGAGMVLPPLNVGAAVGVYLGLVPSPVLTWALLVSAGVLALVSRSIHQGFSAAQDGEGGIRGYGRILRVLEETRLEAEWWRELRDRLGGTEHPAHREIDRLRMLLDMADTRLSPMFHIPLALFLFWDVHVAWALERWRKRSGIHVREWLEAIGDAEACLALAALSHAHPDWAFPRVEGGADRVQGRRVGHPLLSDTSCVRNDVVVGPPGSFLLVTGSNMAGKSTLLRAVGLNVVLARAGGPVCAEGMTLPPLDIWTSMRVDDSLAGGLSFFMAELVRLKRVVEGAEAATPEAPVLYLLDEILQGTNTAERQVAARRVIHRLVESGAIGAVTTHDLTLADSEALKGHSVPVHFTETVEEGGEDEGLHFDYQLRQGISPSTNALKLLRLVGLE